MPPAISSALYAPFTVRPLSGEIGRIAARSLSEADKAKLAEQAGAANTLNQSMKTARDEARGNTKARAKEAVERLKEEFKLIRRMWAHNPKEMAKQLARIAKELKHAVADYAEAAKANGQRAGEAREMLEGVAAAPDAAKADAGEGGKDAPVDPEAAKVVAAYEKTVRDAAVQELESAEGEARGDLEFTREIRGLMKELRKTLQEAKVKAALAAPDKDRAEAFKAADKAMREIDEALEDMEKGVKDAFPDIASGVSGRGVVA